MPKFLEDKLKKEYGADSKIPYKVMNSIGAMHGNKETAKGRAMEAEHASDVKHGTVGQRSKKSRRRAASSVPPGAVSRMPRPIPAPKGGLAARRTASHAAAYGD